MKFMDLGYKIEKGIYLISPPVIEDLDDFTKNLKFIFKRVRITFFQLRLKGVSLETIILTINILRPLCIKFNVQFVLNDDATTAAKYACDGLHIGFSDGSVNDAMKKFHGIIGVSCYNDINIALKACERGASYVSFGAFYETTTKLDTLKCDISVLKDFLKQKKNFPVCVIGGLNAENSKVLVENGASIVALSSAIWSLKKNTEKVLELQKILDYFK